MKIKCKVCRKETEIDELQYNPGDKIVVECKRCGNELEAVIPLREEAPEEKPQVKVVENDLKSVWYAAGAASNPEPPKSESSNPKQQSAPTPPPAPTVAPVNPTRPTPTPQNQYYTPPTNTNGNFQPQQPIYVYPSNKTSSSNGKTILFVVIGVCIVVGIAIWLLIGRSSGREKAYDVAEDSVYAVAAEVVEPVEVVEAVAEPVYDSEIAYEEEEHSSDADGPIVERAFIPAIGTSTSSEAYDVYAPYLTENRFGDAWATTDIIQNAIRNDEVYYFVKGEGDIEGYPLSIDAVWLKNGRLYGRYLNETNGVKLDINGGFDESNDLVIKLGHKSETSYWVLKYAGQNDDGSYQFNGTWGRKDKPTGLRIRLSDRR